MAHLYQRQFCERVKKKHPGFFESARVLDCGSMDVNGNNRYLFDNCTYIGIDMHPGKNVDIVCPIHEFKAEPFDLVISTEMLEHDSTWKESLQNMETLLKPGGLLLVTCATKERAVHGLDEFGHGYYHNLSEAEIREALDIEDIFSEHEFEVYGNDLYFYGIKKGEQP